MTEYLSTILSEMEVGLLKKVSPSLFSYLLIGKMIPDSQDFCND